jgi:hypothetical protein
MGERKVAS